MNIPNFFKQRVNQWLCIALIALMCFWTVLYYMINKAQAFGEEIVESRVDLKL